MVLRSHLVLSKLKNRTSTIKKRENTIKKRTMRKRSIETRNAKKENEK